MKFLPGVLIATLFLLPLVSRADMNQTVEPLSCGIYNQASKPLIEKNLETQSRDRARYTMDLRTSRGKQLRVEVKSVSIQLAGERNHVSIFLDGKPINAGPPPSYQKVHALIEKKVRRLK